MIWPRRRLTLRLFSFFFDRCECAQARDSKGHILAQKEHITKGKFTFSSETLDAYELCFISRVPGGKWKRIIGVLPIIGIAVCVDAYSFRLQRIEA